HAENATYPWYPASVTKIMTTYVTLRAVKEGRITLDKAVAVSPAAASQAPTKMGFPVGTLVTIDNAIKMLMVKSANDMAVVRADGMKTGFICASGFNLVATATRDGKRVIAVVLGAPSGAVRAVKAAQLLERGFTASPLAWLTPSLGTVDALQPINVDPPNLRED